MLLAMHMCATYSEKVKHQIAIKPPPYTTGARVNNVYHHQSLLPVHHLAPHTDHTIVHHKQTRGTCSSIAVHKMGARAAAGHKDKPHYLTAVPQATLPGHARPRAGLRAGH